MVKTRIITRLHRGYIVTKNDHKKYAKKLRPSRNWKLGKRSILIKDVIKEVAGLSPFEKKLFGLLEANEARKFKKATHLAIQRLGTIKRAKNKREQILGVISGMKKKA